MNEITNNNQRQEKLRVPPYVSFKSFNNFLTKIHENGLPHALDRSYWGNWLSGSLGLGMMSTLRFLNLIDEKNVPKEDLKKLIDSMESDPKPILKKIIENAYSPVFEELTNDLSKATPAQLELKFKSQGASGEVIRKCMAFFTVAAKEVGITLSPIVYKRTRTKTTTIKAKPKTRKNGTKKENDYREDIPNEQDSLKEKLLEKFPEFNPEWDAEVQKKWFEAFDNIMERMKE